MINILTAPTLIFAWGNPSRGDDALGPLFAERFAALAEAHPEWGAVECLTDFQLQIEHALDCRDRRRVLFVDASLDTPSPCTLERIAAAKDASFTTHALSPQALLQVYAGVENGPPPPAWLLAIRGEHFQLGEDLSESARRNFDAALERAAAWMTGEERTG